MRETSPRRGSQDPGHGHSRHVEEGWSLWACIRDDGARGPRGAEVTLDPLPHSEAQRVGLPFEILRGREAGVEAGGEGLWIQIAADEDHLARAAGGTPQGREGKVR